MSELTPRAVAFTAHEEGVVLEAYKDGVDVWTWAMGVTNASGHEVYPRYMDKPQPLDACLRVSVWLLQQKYLPAVVAAFDHDLAEHELAAAVSFHWNTGKIASATWPKLVNAGKLDEARASMLTWEHPPSLAPRREREAALFFDGAWPDKMACPVWQVKKPAYRPYAPEPMDIVPALQQIMGGG